MMNHPNGIEIPSAQGDCASPIVLAFVALWVLVVSFGRTLTIVAMSTIEAQVPAWTRLVYPPVEAILLAIPLLPLALFWRNRRYRAVFQALLASTGYVLLLVPTQIPHPYATQTQAGLHTGLSVLYAILVLFITRRLTGQAKADKENLPALAAMGIAAVFAYPWLAFGALGSPLDTILELAAGLSIGASISIVLQRLVILPLAETPAKGAGSLVLGTIGAGLVILIDASALGFGYGTMQALLMIALPSLSLAYVGLYRLFSPHGIGWLPGMLLLGLASAAPMALIDPVEVNLIISLMPGEILQWALIATGTSFVLGWALGVTVIIIQRSRFAGQFSETPPQRSRLVAWQLAVLPWIVGMGIYFIIGQPGFYGEGLFVIFRDQVDVTLGAQSIKDYSQRRQYVFKTLVDQANQSQARLRSILESLHVAYTPYYLENAIEVQGGPALRVWLEAQPEVDRVLSNPWMRPLPASLPVNTGNLPAPTVTQWDLTLIRADRVWKELGITGKGVIVGQSDTGVQWDHPELKADYRGWDAASDKVSNDYNWYDPWSSSPAPLDLVGHGTHTLGSIVGQHTGVAPGANWIACVNLERDLGNPSLYLDCMQFMLAPFPIGGDPFKDGDPARGAMVINNSWACPDLEGCDPEALHPAARAMKAAGIFIVASAGNDGPTCETLKDPLPIYPEVFAVGAIDSASQLAIFSSLGPVISDSSDRIKPEIVAPGVDVLSSMPNNTYGIESGTSMAGPHVVGVVALMWSANPALIGDIDRTASILEQTAQSYTGLLPDCPQAGSHPSSAVGYGIIDAYAAVKMALSLK